MSGKNFHFTVDQFWKAYLDVFHLVVIFQIVRIENSNPNSIYLSLPIPINNQDVPKPVLVLKKNILNVWFPDKAKSGRGVAMIVKTHHEVVLHFEFLNT